MKTYTILRKGSNEYNQSRMLGWVPVTDVEAETREKALEAVENTVECYNNQILDAVTRWPRGYRKSSDGSWWQK